MANRFIYKHRRGTTEQWATSDSIIYDGEIVVEKSNDGYIHLKVGDGTKKFSELPYMNIPMDSFPKELLKITVTSSDSTYSADKTDSDIKSCLDNGGIPYIALYDTVFIYEGYSSDIGYMFIDTNDGKTLCIYNNSVSLYSSNLKSKLDSTVSTIAQSLTEEQQAQARANIGAGTPYTLPEASPDALGGVKADAVEETDTQPVRKGTDGKLYTAPGSGGADISLGISGASAGQMAKVKAVDESGAPTAWEAGDDAGGYSGYGNRNPDYTYTVTEVISELYISEINGNTFSANKLACLVEFPAGTGGLYYHALYTLQGSKDKNYCISNHNAPKLSNISTKDSVVFFIVEKLNNQNYKYNYIGQCKAREQLLDGSYGTYAAGIFPNSIEGETSIKSILLKGENAFGVGVKISIWLN